MNKGGGSKIGIKFTEDLVGDVGGNESAFTITGKEYKYVNGPLIDGNYQIESVERYPVARIYQDDFTNGIKDNTGIIAGGIILSTGDAIDYTDDLTSGLTYISTSDFSASYANYMAFDNNTSTSWSARGAADQAVGVDFGTSRKISKLRMMTNGRLQNFDLEGSNDNSTWAIVYSGTQLRNSNWQEYMFENSVDYRYYRVKCTGSLYTGSNVMITEIEMMESLLAYVGEGNYTTAPIQINGQYRLSWVEVKPINTNIIIEYTTGGTQRLWQEVSNGDIITSDANLWIRATLSTEDETVTPILKDLWLEEVSAPQDKILLTMNPLKRFNNVEGDLTVKYDASKGNLAGSGGAVESFTETLAPTGLVPVPNPGTTETIISTPSIDTAFTKVTYNDRHSSDCIVAKSPSITVLFTNINTINP